MSGVRRARTVRRALPWCARPDTSALGGGDHEFDGGTELAKIATAVNTRERAVERTAEVAALGARLDHPEKRAVLLVGQGGVGKTALLREVARTLGSSGRGALEPAIVDVVIALHQRFQPASPIPGPLRPQLRFHQRDHRADQ